MSFLAKALPRSWAVGEAHPVRPLDIPDLLRANLGLAETRAKTKAGGVQRLPLLLFGLGIVLRVY